MTDGETELRLHPLGLVSLGLLGLYLIHPHPPGGSVSLLTGLFTGVGDWFTLRSWYQNNDLLVHSLWVSLSAVEDPFETAVGMKIGVFWDEELKGKMCLHAAVCHTTWVGLFHVGGEGVLMSC